eukprot:CAMPEP_0174283458 /NCGR_PEP_ID=MMETSP0809-20121228/4158_1 /TAXON_ID=73025 ORGANISM="Eutreptiella gymnastica-like, Strain CCMP1594" /NCGR_SAMPLE_ID=MMETSP0809 /ASSEMBLY_ACC=CAM_ASM_000658 /LENGTH=61 /DNA_ID=CAMNT_0015378405 /DNA_START=225 /DNA_END=410 /DNA_ORIENTATION=-
MRTHRHAHTQVPTTVVAASRYPTAAKNMVNQADGASHSGTKPTYMVSMAEQPQGRQVAGTQ